MIANQDIIVKTLEHYMNILWENNEEFIKCLWRGSEHDELLECYINNQNALIYVLTSSGTTVTDTIKIETFFKWCEDHA